MKGIKTFLVIAICFLCISAGMLFAENTSNITYANADEIASTDSLNEEYDAEYADIVDRYNEGQITLEEAEAEYAVLSQSGVTVEVVEAASKSSGNMKSLTTIGNRSGNVSWIPFILKIYKKHCKTVVKMI